MSPDRSLEHAGSFEGGCTAFALNALIESDRVVRQGTAPEIVDTPSSSGKGQKIARCPRVGTLDDPDVLPPDVHIFTSTRQPWVQLAEATPAFAEFYDWKAVWSEASLARLEQLRPQIAAYRAATSGTV